MPFLSAIVYCNCKDNNYFAFAQNATPQKIKFICFFARLKRIFVHLAIFYHRPQLHMVFPSLRTSYFVHLHFPKTGKQLLVIE